MIRTRFAPSPTGYMHIGGMRTALFNWIWARKHGGQFILRIDDTDKKRNIQQAIDPILDSFKWLGLDWDEGPPNSHYYQSNRSHLYHKALTKLLEEGKAYLSHDDLVGQNEEDKYYRETIKDRNGKCTGRTDLRFSLDEKEVNRRAEYYGALLKPCVRLLVPRTEYVRFHDEVRGDMEFDCSEMQDPVIARVDASPLYNFATVIDDADMGITDVIRGEEHLSNTPVQILIYQALGLDIPRFAHIPYVAAPGSKEKLSKRKTEKYRKNPQFKKLFEEGDEILSLLGRKDAEDSVNPVTVAYYGHMGYLPDAVFNYLAKLGWSLDDKTEVIDRETIIKNFELKDVVKAPASFDPDKLNYIQSEWMKQKDIEDKLCGCFVDLVVSGLLDEDTSKTENDMEETDIKKLIELLGTRISKYSDILKYKYFFQLNIDYNDKDFKKNILPNEVELRRLYEQLPVTDSHWSEEHLKAAFEICSNIHGQKLGKAIGMMRTAIFGTASGPDFFKSMELVGKKTCIKRINEVLESIK